MTIPDALAQRKLSDTLCQVAEGTVIRTRAPHGGWTLYVDNDLVDNGETALALSILDAQHYITWWPKHSTTQKACLSLDKGVEAYYQLRGEVA